MSAFLDSLAGITIETAPWLLVGFALAGWLKVLLPEGLVAGHLGGDDLGAVTRASLYGAPLPLCSCSVIPFAATLRRSGASKGSTTSFLIATPETGVDSISVTWALLDPLLTVVRPLVAVVTAIVTGLGVNLLVRRGWDDPGTDADRDLDEACCDSACGDTPAAGDHDHGAPAGPAWLAGLRYGFGPLLDDLTPTLVPGLVLSALLAAFLPDDLLTGHLAPGLPSMLAMLVLSLPLYICATASTPLAAVLIAKGLDPGAALVLLLVGPATNLATLLVVVRLLGRRVLAVYLAGLAGVALVAGALVGRWYEHSGLDLGAALDQALHEEHGPVAVAAAVLLALLLGVSGLRLMRQRAARG